MNLTNLLSQFQTSAVVNPTQLFLQAILLVFLAALLSVIYILQGNSLSNRSRLAMIFPLMALTTMLIIIVVKSSLALSLGLVGALSIVRFRAAIKDPEELTYIFLTIALGLGFGATQIAITTTFFIFAVIVILGQKFLSERYGNTFVPDHDLMQLELVFSKEQSFSEVLAILQKSAKEVQLSKLDDGKEQSMLFLIKPKETTAIDALKSDLRKLDKKVRVTALSYQPIV